MIRAGSPRWAGTRAAATPARRRQVLATVRAPRPYRRLCRPVPRRPGLRQAPAGTAAGRAPATAHTFNFSPPLRLSSPSSSLLPSAGQPRSILDALAPLCCGPARRAVRPSVLPWPSRGRQPSPLLISTLPIGLSSTHQAGQPQPHPRRPARDLRPVIAAVVCATRDGRLPTICQAACPHRTGDKSRIPTLDSANRIAHFSTLTPLPDHSTALSNIRPSHSRPSTPLNPFLFGQPTMTALQL
ncbi:hypothetical protein CDD83_291 [Cordyceps sp. RAO-2017]|nr:hypothetical protein CDD83_291 [Cordyceps sp. RAO-2017]